MRAVVHAPQAAGVDVAVGLRRRERRVAEELLDDAEVGAALEQGRRERVPQAVWVAHEPPGGGWGGPDALGGGRVGAWSARGEEDRVLRAAREYGAAIAEIAGELVRRLL